ncbi:hypothetical protein LINPERPRIM_LOCUS8827, partial [Linum perenne]
NSSGSEIAGQLTLNIFTPKLVGPNSNQDVARLWIKLKELFSIGKNNLKMLWGESLSKENTENNDAPIN